MQKPTVPVPMHLLGGEDFDAEVDHLIHNYEFLHLELEYDTLEPGAAWRLCQIGQCRRCGGRLCIGTSLTARDDLEDTLSSIHHVACQAWHNHTGKHPDGDKDFCERFSLLFHEGDRKTVRDWLSRQEAPSGSRKTDTPRQEAH